MVNHESRLAIHEHQIKQLQGDVAEIKTTLKVLVEDRLENREFQKIVLAWIKRHTSNSVVESSCPGSGSISPTPSVVVQLEALVSRSEERWNNYGHQDNKNTDGSSVSGLSGAVFPGSASKLDPLSDPEIASVMARSSANAIKSANLHDTLVGHDEEQKLVVGLDLSVLGPFTKLGSNMACTGLLKGKTGSWDFTIPAIPFPQLQPRTNTLPMATFKLGDQRLGWKGGTISLFVGSSVAFALWLTFLVNGQGRPPETSFNKASTW